MAFKECPNYAPAPADRPDAKGLINVGGQPYLVTGPALRETPGKGRGPCQVVGTIMQNISNREKFGQPTGPMSIMGGCPACETAFPEGSTAEPYRSS